MARTPRVRVSVGTCPVATVNGPCGKPNLPGGSLCWAHYRRTKREGKALDAPVHEYGAGREQLNGPLLAERVMDLVETAAELHRVANFTLTSRIVSEWLARYEDTGSPFLTKGMLDRDPVTERDGASRRTRMFSVSAAEMATLERAEKQFPGMPLMTLLTYIFDDWYYFWTEHKKAPKGLKTAASPRSV